MIGLWSVAVVKVVAAVLAMLALSRRPSPTWHRILWVLAWADAVILTVYGLVFTISGLLIQAGVVYTGPRADHRALTWHAYLWDPWFLFWGLLVGTALLCGRPRNVLPAATAPSAR
jgi:hypothetical protein